MHIFYFFSGAEIMETKLAKQTEIVGTTEKTAKTEVGQAKSLDSRTNRQGLHA